MNYMNEDMSKKGVNTDMANDKNGGNKHTAPTLLDWDKGTSVARVYCQDMHATDWTPLGYSCPINCASVIQAVERLKAKDHEELFAMYLPPFMHKIQNMSEFDLADISGLEELDTVTDDDEDNFIKSPVMRTKDKLGESIPSRELKAELKSMLSDKRIRSELRLALKSVATVLKNGSCGKPEQSKDRTGIAKCTRRKHGNENIVHQFTAILNKHTTSNFFTDRITEMVVKKLIGTSDMQTALLDVPDLIRRLDEVSKMRASPHFITLKPKYCLNVYVEQNGQCVRPPDCLPADADRDYVARVHVQ